MTLNRFAKKRDAAERPIIETLEAHGYEVWPLDKPCDLAVRKQHWPPGIVQLLEIKNPGARARKDQQAQQTFLRTTGTPIVRTPIEALKFITDTRI